MSAPGNPPQSLHVSYWGLAALIVWLLGMFASAFGGHELLTSYRCGASPSRIQCAELARRGPPGNDFITLTNFTPKLDGYVYYQDEHGHWCNANVPLVADGEATPQVIVHVQQPQNDQHLRDALTKAEITGVITSRGLFREPSNALVGYNPGMDPGLCWVLTLDAHPYDKRTLSLVFFAGLALFTASIWMFVEKHKPAPNGQMSGGIHMSPLLVLVDGLHALARWLPLPGRRACGAVLLPFAAALAAYGGYLFVKLSAPQTVTQVGTEILCIGSLDMGVSLTVVALSFLLIDRAEGD